MNKFSLPDLLDEALILHSAIATKLLSAFPEAHGVHFFPNHKSPAALPTADVPAGYADAYRNSDFERMAKELLDEIAPRMAEIKMAYSPLDDITLSFSGKRSSLEYRGKNTDVIIMTGAFSGGVGSVMIRRRLAAMNTRFVATTAREFSVFGVVSDPAKRQEIEEISRRGLRKVMEHMVHNDLLLLSRSLCEKTPDLLKWLDHFPELRGRVSVSYDWQVCHVQDCSKERVTFLAAPLGDLDLDKTDADFIVYDPKSGIIGDLSM